MRRDRTAVLHFLAQVIRSIAGFGTTLFAARTFGAGGLGVYSQVLALLFWLKLPSNSVTTAVSKRMSESEELTGHFTAGLTATAGYGLLVAGFLLLFERSVNDYLNAEAAILLIVLLLANVLFDFVKGGFIGRKRVALSGWLGTAEQILRLGSQVAFVLIGSTVLGLVFGHIVSLLVFSLFGLWLLRDRLTIPTLSDFEDLKRFAQYSWLGNLKGVALSWLDILVLGFFVADSFVGIYTAAWTLSSFLSLASKSIRQTLFPELSGLGADNQEGEALGLVGDGLLFTGIFLIPGAFGALVIGDRILKVYESGFAIGGTVLVILIGARTLHGFGSQFVSAINGLDRPEIAFRINGVFLATNAVLNVALVYEFGWYGAAAASFVSTGVYLIAAWYAVRREFGHVRIPFLEVSRQLFAAATMALVVQLSLPLVPGGLLATLALVFGGAAVYGSMLLVLSPEIRERTRNVAGV